MPQDCFQEAIRSMATLNRIASETMMEVSVNACTDVTGFGLLGHLYGMVSASDVGAVLYVNDVPILSGARDLARKGVCSSANARNKLHVRDHIIASSGFSSEDDLLFHEAETSGGLLISVTRSRASRIISLLHQRGVVYARIIGEIVEEPEGKIVLA